MKSMLTFAAGMQLIRRTCTMKRIWGSSVAALLAMTSSGAFAADLPIRKAPPPLPIPIYNWTGFYIGGNAGGVWETGTISDNFFGTSFSNSRSGFIGGGQIGYNWQVSPQWVLGVEWMFDGTSISSDTGNVVGLGGTLISANEKANWLTTVTGRVGYAANNWLFYAKGGGGWVHDTATLTDITDGISFSASDTRGGWVAGGGIEYGFTPNWTVRVDYQHLGLEDVTRGGFFVNDAVTLSRHFDMVTAGVNYKF
jgi:outer membrane immunogenic protein